MFNSDAAIAELAKSVDELSGKVAGLIAYVGHLPRADSVRPEAVKGLVRVRVDLDEAHVAEWPDPHELLAVDEAIRRLEEEDDRAADIVRLRYFAGLSVEETAKALDLSERTVMREWAYAKAWLRDALGTTGE